MSFRYSILGHADTNFCPAEMAEIAETLIVSYAGTYIMYTI